MNQFNAAVRMLGVVVLLLACSPGGDFTAAGAAGTASEAGETSTAAKPAGGSSHSEPGASGAAGDGEAIEAGGAVAVAGTSAGGSSSSGGNGGSSSGGSSGGNGGSSSGGSSGGNGGSSGSGGACTYTGMPGHPTAFGLMPPSCDQVLPATNGCDTGAKCIWERFVQSGVKYCRQVPIDPMHVGKDYGCSRCEQTWSCGCYAPLYTSLKDNCASPSAACTAEVCCEKPTGFYFAEACP